MKQADKKTLLEAYIARATPMPTLPEAVIKVLQLSDNPDVRVEDVADAIMKDKVLTARMIRLINSAYWGLRREVKSIRETIVYLGMQQIRNIVLTTSLFNTFKLRNGNFKITNIWEHGMGCAMISRILAEKVKFKDLEAAYLGGLLHDIGEVVLSQFSFKEFDEVIDLVEKERISFYEAENRIIGLDHTDFGPWFRDQWGFSDELMEVIATHHDPQKARLNPELVSIVYLADLFCRVRGLDYGFAEFFQVSFQDEAAWQILTKSNPALNNIDLARFTMDLDGMVEEVKKLVKSFYHD